MKRRHDIDWLRIIAIFLVLYFHVAMIFTEEWDWHIKNDELSYLWLEFNFWLSRFRMPLLFFISGYGTFLALRKRNSWTYIKERHNRLMIPLVFSMFVIVPPQIYFERIFDNPGSYSSFFSFYPQTFALEPYPEGNFSWHHMWFVLYLFFYSLVGLPLFLWLKKWSAKKSFAFQKSYNLFLFLIPTTVVYVFVLFGNDRTNDFINDWPAHLYWFTFFFMGYLVGCFPSVWDLIEKNRRNLLGLAILCIVVINYFRWNQIEPWEMENLSPVVRYLAIALLPINSWLWILAALGLAKRYLNKPSPILNYMNRAIYPFYILHQTVIIVIGYYVIQVSEGILSKFILISSLSIIFTLAIYEYMIRPYKPMRFLFGVKEEKRPGSNHQAHKIELSEKELEKVKLTGQ